MTKPAAILIRVGIETATGGICGPIYANGDFEYIPFPEEILCSVQEQRIENLRAKGLIIDRYGDLHSSHPAHRVRVLSELLPCDFLTIPHDGKKKKLMEPASLIPHFDPDLRFKTFGDFWKTKSWGRLPNSWRTLDPRDDVFLFFVQSLWLPQSDAWYDAPHTYSQTVRAQGVGRSIYLTGMLHIRQLIDVEKAGGWSNVLDTVDDAEGVINNFHYKRHVLLSNSSKRLRELDDDAVILIGESTNTRLFTNPIRLKKGETYTGPTRLGKILGVTANDIVRFKPLNEVQRDAVLREINQM